MRLVGRAEKITKEEKRKKCPRFSSLFLREAETLRRHRHGVNAFDRNSEHRVGNRGQNRWQGGFAQTDWQTMAS